MVDDAGTLSKAAKNKLWREANPPDREAARKYAKEWRLRRPAKQLLMAARTRAKRKGLPFDLREEDIVIPEVCPILGVKLVPGSRQGAPSLDRLIPELGYVRGNVAVISLRANRKKADSTADELRRIADWMDKTNRTVEPGSPSMVGPSSGPAREEGG